MAFISSSVGFKPKLFITAPSSFREIEPFPSLSNSLNASVKTVKCNVRRTRFQRVGVFSSSASDLRCLFYSDRPRSKHWQESVISTATYEKAATCNVTISQRSATNENKNRNLVTIARMRDLGVPGKEHSVVFVYSHHWSAQCARFCKAFVTERFYY